MLDVILIYRHFSACSAIAALSFFATAAAHADDGSRADVVTPAPATITLGELVRAARDDPPAVLEALATLHRIEAEHHSAAGAYLPKLTADGTLGLQYDNRSVLPGETDASSRIDSTSLAAIAQLNVDWTAVDLQRRHNVASLAAAARAQRGGVKSSVRLATMAAVELYVRALFAGDLVADAELTLTRRKQQQETIEELTRAGVRPAVDAVRARVELLAASYVHQLRRTEERAAFAALAASIGRDPETGLVPAALDGSVFVGPIDVREASALAQHNRPELTQLRAQIEQFSESERAAQGARAPTGGVFARGSGTYYDVLRGNGIDGDQYSGGGGLYVQWRGGDAQVLREKKVANRRLEEAKTRLRRTELSVRAEAVDAAYAVQRAQFQLDQANQVLEAAKAARVVQHERYGVGMASLLELLDAEAIEQNARRTRIEALRDFDLSRARVLAVCGTLSDRIL